MFPTHCVQNFCLSQAYRVHTVCRLLENSQFVSYLVTSSQYSSFIFHRSVDCLVMLQVINMKELQEVATLGIPIFGINLSVGLAVRFDSFSRE